MKITKSKLLQIIKEELEEAEVLDFTSFKRKKEKTWKQPDTFMVHVEGEPMIYEPFAWRLVKVYNDDQYEALEDGDYEKAEDLGVQFAPILEK